ncbi:hypothetical protein QYS49_13455 [Marivirga salinae]|uniref:Outer membrane protein beta-barrel domain-containing protein n=1 Tax=Marivirga salinarum TaxID=3059078 RepID=A0AA49JH43_9BACT|nr:hypothetical protein [Marivirga sp. BDSF4-3]WKK77973.2 hypothetical protein QYS49_13455 [Marivirga sp. BDSF4-3]
MKHLVIILLTILPLKIFAQEISFEHPSVNSFDFGINIAVGFKYSKIDELNKQLEAASLPKGDSNLPYLGGGMNFIYGNHFLHFNGNAAFNDDENELDGFTITTRGWGIGINYGYKIGLPIFNLIPTIGVSREALLFQIEDLSGKNQSFTNQLQNFNLLQLHSEILAASLGVKILFHDDYGTLFPSLSFEYQIPMKSIWIGNDSQISEAPSIEVSKFKLGIEIFLFRGQNNW